ncbi:MAG: type I asparaginase [Bacteroidales bacterium]|nr:type I asparaginase [Bacteroidales bacterium]
MKKILLIYTGGTIGMRENPETGALESVDFDKSLPLLKEVRALRIDVETVKFEPAIDSSDINPSHWRKLAEIIAANYDRFFGFVILHGTDTMAYTASALSFMLEGLSKPVVLTGSQLPIGKIRTDGKENLITAMEIASAEDGNGNPMVPEVSIFFHDKLLRGNRSTKSSADRFDAFTSFNYPPLARAAVDILYDREYILPYRPDNKLKLHLSMDNRVIVLSLFPGIPEDMVRGMLSIPSLKGVVLRTFGSGNAPQEEWLNDLLREASAKGVVIVNITQCAGGYVAMSRYETGLHLQQAGVLSGSDSTVEAALTKMMRLFGDGLTPAEVREKMSIALCGEF